MLVELERTDYKKTTDLFSALEYNLSISSVINLLQPGLIFADNKDKPNCAFAITPEGMYFSGKPGITQFDTGMNLYLKNNFFKKAVSEELVDYVLFYPSESFENSITTIFNGLYPRMVKRYYYSLNPENYSCDELINNVRLFDKDTFQNSSFENSNEIQHLLERNWGSLDNFLSRGFGYYYPIANKIVSWCIADCVVDEKCEIGVETLEDYRRQGFSMAAIKATILLCKNKNIRTVGWHCWNDNVASVTIAEKAGFKREREITVYSGWYDELPNCLINGNHYLKYNQNYSKSSFFYSLALDKNFGWNWHYFNAACVNWKLGKIETAKKYYAKALEMEWEGFQNENNCEYSAYFYDEDDVIDIEQKLIDSVSLNSCITP